MSPVLLLDANLSPATHQAIALDALALTVLVTHLAEKHQVSRKFICQQGRKAQQALDESCASSQGDDDFLFHLPVLKAGCIN